MTEHSKGAAPDQAEGPLVYGNVLPDDAPAALHLTADEIMRLSAPSSSSSGAPEPPLERQRRDLSPIPLYTLTPPIVSTDMLFGPGAAYIQPRAPAPDAGTTDAPMRTHCHDCDRPNLCDIIKRGTAPCGQNAGMGKAAADLYAETEAERKRLTAELSRLRASLAERQGAEPPTGSKTREIL